MTATTDNTLTAPNSLTGSHAAPGKGMPRLTGNSKSRCAACKRSFTTTANFDKHRAWHPDDATDVSNRRRICLDPAVVGLVLRDSGFWGAPPMTDDERTARGWA